MNPKLIGTWFLVRNNTEDNKDLMVTKAKGVKPSELNDGAFTAEETDSGWMSLDSEEDFFPRSDYDDLTPADFNALDLPEVTYENSPLEIEIMPSGKVYFW